MRKRSAVNGLGYATTALFLATVAAACGGGSSPPTFGPPPGSGTNHDGGVTTGNGTDSGTQGGNNPPPLGGNVGHDSGSSQNMGDAGCAGAMATATATTQPVEMLFILDGSGSMNQQSKWTAATGALTNIFNDMAAKNDPGLYAGLIVFSDANDPTQSGFGGGGGPYPSSADVPIAQVNSSQAQLLTARYGGGDMPSGGTPTGTVLGGGYPELETYNGAPNAKKVLILITDGVPTDNCSPGGAGSYPTNQCVTQAAGELTKAAPAGPIETFVIGVGVFPSTNTGNFDPSFLGYLAQAGGSGAMGCNPSENSVTTDLCYFEVDPSGSSTATQMAFENAINAIRGKVVSLSCTFKLNLNDAGMIDPTKVNVTVNGMTIPQDPTNGWTYDNPSNPTSVTLHGTSCSEVTATATATVSIILGCATIVPPPAQ